MLIAIDATAVTRAGKGVASYGRRMIRAWMELPTDARYVVWVREDAREAFPPDDAAWKFEKVTVGSSLLWHWIDLPKLLRARKPDRLYVLTECPLPRLDTPYVMLVHELPQVYRRRVPVAVQSLQARLSGWIHRRFTADAVRRAERVLTVSQSVRSDVISEWGISPDKVQVASGAADEIFFGSSGRAGSGIAGLPEQAPYFLIFATGDRRELPDQAIRAFAKTAEQLPRHYLAVAGRCPEPLKKSLMETADRAGIASRVLWLGYVPEADLPGVYAGAAVYVELSHYEGFGLQACEALASGASVILSDIPAFRELAGDAARFIGLDRLDDLPGLLIETARQAQDPAIRSATAQKSIARARKYGWPQTAANTWQCLSTRPCVSVVIPTYNRAAQTVEALKSVLSQTCPPVEVIIVDDGSTDATEEAVHPYLTPAVRYHRIAHRGRSAARNTGIQLSTGEWIAFLDSDDVWLPDKLKIQMDGMEHAPTDVALLYGDCRMTDASLRPVAVSQPAGWRPGLRDSYENYLKGSNIFTSSVAIRRSALEEAGGYWESLHGLEDHELYLRLLLRGCSFLKLSGPPQVLYRKHAGNTDARTADHGYLKLYERHLGLLQSRPGKEGRRLRALALSRLAETRHRLQDYPKSAEDWARAVQEDRRVLLCGSYWRQKIRRQILKLREKS